MLGLKRGNPADLLFEMSVKDLHDLLFKGAAAAEVEILQPVPYHLRHTGVSHEMVSGQRTLAEAKRRGQWTADSSLRRYSKGGRIAEQMARLPPGVQAHCYACHEQICEILAGRRAPFRLGAVSG